MMDRWMEDGHTERQMHRKIMLFSHNHTMKGSDVASLIDSPQWFRRR